MKIPDGMTEDEVVKIIEDVTSRLARCFKFGYHDLEDIKQQAALYAWEVLPKYSGPRPLKNFLWVHIRNRLINFKRDKYERIILPCVYCNDCNQKDDSCDLYDVKDDCKIYWKWVLRNNAKKNIMRPIALISVKGDRENNMKVSDSVESQLCYKELLDILDHEIPIGLRADYFRLINGIKILKTRKLKIQEIVSKVLQRYGYDEETWSVVKK